MATFIPSTEDIAGNKTDEPYPPWGHILVGVSRGTNNKHVKNKRVSGSTKYCENN